MPLPCASAWPNSSFGWPTSKPGEAARIARRLAESGIAPEAFRAAVLQRLLREDAALARGITAYRAHPHRRTLPDPPVIWREGSARLLDHGGAGPPVLFVPSLVNRAHVLDLDEGASLMRFLATEGLRPLLLDWGWPEAAERGMTLTDHIAGRLERALLALPGPVVLAGYCMGGLLALAAALRRPDRVTALVLLATPWDFHVDPQAGRGGPPAADTGAADGAGRSAAGGCHPRACSPCSTPSRWRRSFRAFGRMDQDSARARRFVVLEDWLNDGIPCPPRWRARRSAAGTARTRRRAANGAWPACRCGQTEWTRPGLRRHPEPRPHRPARLGGGPGGGAAGGRGA
jgi:pimeloyl-ACP methyl ester carboxylesterase